MAPLRAIAELAKFVFAPARHSPIRSQSTSMPAAEREGVRGSGTGVNVGRGTGVHTDIRASVANALRILRIGFVVSVGDVGGVER
jgi:hypothetical protein